MLKLCKSKKFGCGGQVCDKHLSFAYVRRPDVFRNASWGLRKTVKNAPSHATPVDFKHHSISEKFEFEFNPAASWLIIRKYLTSCSGVNECNFFKIPLHARLVLACRSKFNILTKGRHVHSCCIF